MACLLSIKVQWTYLTMHDLLLISRSHNLCKPMTFVWCCNHRCSVGRQLPEYQHVSTWHQYVWEHEQAQTVDQQRMDYSHHSLSCPPCSQTCMCVRWVLGFPTRSKSRANTQSAAPHHAQQHQQLEGRKDNTFWRLSVGLLLHPKHIATFTKSK